MIPQHLTDAVAEAERRLSWLQQAVSRPGATLEDEHALERGRNRLLEAELRAERAKSAALRRALLNRPQSAPQSRRETARERAEAVFAK